MTMLMVMQGVPPVAVPESACITADDDDGGDEDEFVAEDAGTLDSASSTLS